MPQSSFFWRSERAVGLRLGRLIAMWSNYPVGDELRTTELGAKALVAIVFFIERWAGRLALALLASSCVVLVWDIAVWLFKADWRTSSFIYPPVAFLLGCVLGMIREKCDTWIMREVEEDRARRLQR